MRNVGAASLPRRRACRLDADVLRAHPFDHVLHQLRLALRGIEVEFAHDLLEASAAQDLLIERCQAIFEANPYGRLHVALGDLLRHDENERLGAKPIRQAPRHSDRCHRRQHERHQHQPLRRQIACITTSGV